MIKGATTYVNKYTGETKQVCPKCERKMPLFYKVCLGCEESKKKEFGMETNL